LFKKFLNANYISIVTSWIFKC